MSLEAAQLMLALKDGFVKQKRPNAGDDKPDGAVALKKRRYGETRPQQQEEIVEQQQQQHQQQQVHTSVVPSCSSVVRVVSPAQQAPTIEEVQSLCDRLKQKIATLSAEEMSAFVRGDVANGRQSTTSGNCICTSCCTKLQMC
jgi:hypothetical protein